MSGWSQHGMKVLKIELLLQNCAEKFGSISIFQKGRRLTLQAASPLTRQSYVPYQLVFNMLLTGNTLPVPIPVPGNN
jgi:hypothetical protein